MDTKQQIGSRIKALRRLKGYSQEKLAEVVGINSKYLSSIERGAENPTLDMLIGLAKGLEVELQEMFRVENTGQTPAELRKRLRTLAPQIKTDDLTRALRIIEALIHG